MKPWARAAVQGAACGLMFGLVLLVGWCLRQPATLDVVRARGFKVVDAAGKPRAVLGMVPDGHPGLVLSDAAGKVRADLSMTKDGNPCLRLADKAGISRAVLGATSLETVKSGEVTMRPESSLVLFDKDRKTIWQAA